MNRRAISKEEFSSLLRLSQGSEVSETMLDQIWADIDLDCDGLVKYEMLHVCKRH